MAANLPKTIHIISAVSTGIAVVGFFLGTRPQAAAPPLPQAAPPPEQRSAWPSQTYAALRDRRTGPRNIITSNPQELQAGIPTTTTAVPRTADDLRSALAARAEHRAYDGAPPTIPHPIDELMTQSCVACHGAGMSIGGKIAPVISHAHFSSCTQCHVSVWRHTEDKSFPMANSFVGQRLPAHGTRAWHGAPPTIPHPTFMRQSCTSCHGLTARPGLRTSHPGRKSCPQCHAPDLNYEHFDDLARSPARQNVINGPRAKGK